MTDHSQFDLKQADDGDKPFYIIVSETTSANQGRQR